MHTDSMVTIQNLPGGPEASRLPGESVALPRNWEAVAAASGHDPEEVWMQKETYGWKVGTQVAEVPPGEHRVVYVRDLTPWVCLAWFTLLVLFCPFAITFGSRITPRPTSTPATGPQPKRR